MGDAMATIVTRSVLCLGGAALAAGSLGSNEAEAQSLEGGYGGLSFGVFTGQPDDSWPEYSFTGAATGLFLGYNAVLGDSFGGNLVVGPELVWHNRANITFYDNYSFRNILDLRLRVGQSFGDSLVYGAVGWSRATPSFGGGKVIMGSPTATGLNIGIGFEVGLGNNMFVGGDLTRRNLSGSNGKMSGSGNLTSATVRLGLRF